MTPTQLTGMTNVELLVEKMSEYWRITDIFLERLSGFEPPL